MKSKIQQLALAAGVLTVSFAAQAAPVAVNEDFANTVVKATDANVYGHVKDKSNGEHMPYVTIRLKGTTIGTTTDNTGHYFLKNLPEGTFTIGCLIWDTRRRRRRLR